MYNGQWQGRNKQGLGVYRYPGGARYEGEWRNNSKEGRGVYTFPKVNFPAARDATYAHTTDEWCVTLTQILMVDVVSTVDAKGA